MTETPTPQTGRHRRRATAARPDGGGALLGWLPAVALIALVGISGSSAGLDGQSVTAQLAASDPMALNGPLATGEPVASVTTPDLTITPPADTAPTGTDLVPLPLPGAPAAPVPPAPTGAVGATVNIPATVLEAYRRAAQTLAGTRASCRLPWSLLAGVGRVESGHASQGRVDAAGNTRGNIIGIPLDGSRSTAAIRDTDGGQLDSDTLWDRAVGPMQFIPSTWKRFAADGDGDGVASPHNVFDAALTAGQYLCQGGGDLSQTAGQVTALMSYNRSAAYGALVRRWAALYDGRVTAVPGAAGDVPRAPVNVPPAAVAQLAAVRRPLPAASTPAASTPAVAAPAVAVPEVPVGPAVLAAPAPASAAPASSVAPAGPTEPAPATEPTTTATPTAPATPTSPATSAPATSAQSTTSTPAPSTPTRSSSTAAPASDETEPEVTAKKAATSSATRSTTSAAPAIATPATDSSSAAPEPSSSDASTDPAE